MQRHATNQSKDLVKQQADLEKFEKENCTKLKPVEPYYVPKGKGKLNDYDSSSDSDTDSSDSDSSDDDEPATQRKIEEVEKKFCFHSGDSVIDFLNWRDLVKYEKGLYILGKISAKNFGSEYYVAKETKFIGATVPSSQAILASLGLSLEKSGHLLVCALKSTISVVPKICTLKPHKGGFICHFIPNSSNLVLPPPATSAKKNDQIDFLMDQYIDKLTLDEKQFSAFENGYDYGLEVATATIMGQNLNSSLIEQNPQNFDDDLVADMLSKVGKESKKRAPLTPVQTNVKKAKVSNPVANPPVQVAVKIEADNAELATPSLVSNNSNPPVAVKSEAVTVKNEAVAIKLEADKFPDNASIADSGVGSSIAGLTQTQSTSKTLNNTQEWKYPDDLWSDDDDFDQLASQYLSKK